MQREIRRQMLKAQLNELPDDLADIAYLVDRAMPFLTPPDAFVHSLRMNLVDTATASSMAADQPGAHRSLGMRLLIGAAATASIMGAGFIIRRSHVLDDIPPTITSLLSKGEGALGSKVANASR